VFTQELRRESYVIPNKHRMQESCRAAGGVGDSEGKSFFDGITDDNCG